MKTRREQQPRRRPPGGFRRAAEDEDGNQRPGSAGVGPFPPVSAAPVSVCGRTRRSQEFLHVSLSECFPPESEQSANTLVCFPDSLENHPRPPAVSKAGESLRFSEPSPTSAGSSEKPNYPKHSQISHVHGQERRRTLLSGVAASDTLLPSISRHRHEANQEHDLESSPPQTAGKIKITSRLVAQPFKGEAAALIKRVPPQK